MYYAKAKREPATSTKINCTIKGGKLCKQPTKRAAPLEALATPPVRCFAPALAQWQEICIIMINTGERERSTEERRARERERTGIRRPAGREEGEQMKQGGGFALLNAFGNCARFFFDLGAPFGHSWRAEGVEGGAGVLRLEVALGVGRVFSGINARNQIHIK